MVQTAVCASHAACCKLPRPLWHVSGEALSQALSPTHITCSLNPNPLRQANDEALSLESYSHHLQPKP